MNYKKWSFWEKFLRIIEVIAVVGASYVVAFQIPRQIKEWQGAQTVRALDQLSKLDEKLKQRTNREIFDAIQRNQPILKENNGKFEAEELDDYLDVLGSIEEAYERNIISKDLAYNWFSDYSEKSLKNKEIIAYLNSLRAENPDYYSGIEQFVEKIIEKND